MNQTEGLLVVYLLEGPAEGDLLEHNGVDIDISHSLPPTPEHDIESTNVTGRTTHEALNTSGQEEQNSSEVAFLRAMFPDFDSAVLYVLHLRFNYKHC